MEIEYEVKNIVFRDNIVCGYCKYWSSKLSYENIAISLKVPGNDAKQYPLALQKMQDGVYSCRASEKLPLNIIRQVVGKDGKQRITVTLKALENVYFNTGTDKDRLQAFGLPVLHAGFLVSPQPAFAKEAPSSHTSDSWLVREDRLSAPLTAAFNPASGTSMSVIRIDKFDKETLTTHKEGEVILSGETSIGYTGFCNVDGVTVRRMDFPL